MEIASLKEGVAPGNVFLVADVDAFYDRFAYNIQNFGGKAKPYQVKQFLQLIEQYNLQLGE